MSGIGDVLWARSVPTRSTQRASVLTNLIEGIKPWASGIIIKKKKNHISLSSAVKEWEKRKTIEASDMQGCRRDSPDQPGKAVWMGRAHGLPPHRHRLKTTFTNSSLRPWPTFYQNLSCAKQALCNLEECQLLFYSQYPPKKKKKKVAAESRSRIVWTQKVEWEFKKFQSSDPNTDLFSLCCIWAHSLFVSRHIRWSHWFIFLDLQHLTYKHNKGLFSFLFFFCFFFKHASLPLPIPLMPAELCPTSI